jgi:hypothetical protein
VAKTGTERTMDSKKSTAIASLDSRHQGFWNRQPSETLPADRDVRPTRQRVGIRKAIACNILVRAGGSYVLAHKIHDISLVGAFVEMDTAGLAVGEIVDIVVDFACGDRQVEHQFTAEITRVEHRGVGLKFNAYGDRTYTDLVNLLYSG